MSIYAFEGKIPIIAPNAYLHENAQVIGDVVIGEECYVGAGAIIRGDYGSIRIGDRTAVEEACIIHAPPGETCNIGTDVVLGHGAIIHGSEIECHVRVGMGAIAALHSVVEEWAVIGDGAVITPNQRVSSAGVFVGNPAKEVRRLVDRDKEMSIMAAKLYVDLCTRYHAGLQRLSP